jgi:hypothetical protein
VTKNCFATELKVETSGIVLKCFLLCLALWNRAESVELILPNSGKQSFRTKKHFSYYKFFVPNDVDNFRLSVSSCVVRLSQRPIALKNEADCIDYVAMRGKVRI